MRTGLLERLPGWVFIEWSKANDFVQDINFPSNMLYSAALSAAGELFSDEELKQKSEKLREIIRERSFDGEFFRDNEVYNKDGVPSATGKPHRDMPVLRILLGRCDKGSLS